MEEKEQLIEWSKKVRQNKKDLDLRMFDDLMKNVLGRIDRNGWDDTFQYVINNEKGVDSNMVGPRLLGINSRMIRQKMWSIKSHLSTLPKGKAT